MSGTTSKTMSKTTYTTMFLLICSLFLSSVYVLWKFTLRVDVLVDIIRVTTKSDKLHYPCNIVRITNIYNTTNTEIIESYDGELEKCPPILPSVDQVKMWYAEYNVYGKQLTIKQTNYWSRTDEFKFSPALCVILFLAVFIATIGSCLTYLIISQIRCRNKEIPDNNIV